MTRSARREAGRLAWSAIWGGCPWLLAGCSKCTARAHVQSHVLLRPCCFVHACKPCCLMLGGCVTHRRAVATSPLGSGGSGSGGGGGAALARRNLPRCHSCGCHKCKGTRRACNAPASVMQDWKDAHLGAIPKNLRSSKVKVCVRCKAVCWMVPLLAVVPVEPAVHDDAAVSAALVSQGAGDEFTSDDDASGESE